MLVKHGLDTAPMGFHAGVPIWDCMGMDKVMMKTPLYIEDRTGVGQSIDIVTDNYSSVSGAPTVEYSYDAINWDTLGQPTDTPLSINIPASGRVYIRSKRVSGWGRSNGGTHFSGGTDVNAGGNILSLIYGDEFMGEETSINTGYTYQFYGLFKGMTSLVSVASLVLPIFRLSAFCYGRMFDGCTSLVDYPIINTNVLNEYCYGRMFAGCTSLVTAPQLPITTLVKSCYYNMFTGCTSLVNAPVLPATNLAEACYWLMFEGCTSLEIPPYLPATTLVKNCYYKLFANCTSLKEIRCNATDVTADNCTYQWVYNTNGNVVFYKNANMNSWPSGPSGIPSNWTVLDL